MSHTQSKVVTTQFGEVAGHVDDHDTWCWKGIPYAAAPVGELRWKAPRPPHAWKGVLDCSTWPKLACQASQNRGEGTSEDCLYLNIWRPSTEQQGLPVHFWIHGGGNYVALPANPSTPGHRIAHDANVVVVTIHYRLGELGWFSHPALRNGDNGQDDSANYGLLDQIAALRWVRDNIEAFGGNPNNVFICGESAGGRDVLCLLASPAAKGLFHKAMAQSGDPYWYTREEADAKGQLLLEHLLQADGTVTDEATAKAHAAGMEPAAIAAYLRARPFADLLKARRKLGLPLSCIADGIVLPEEGFVVFERGTYPNRVPTIIGINKEETKLALFLTRAYRRMDTETYQQAAKHGSDLWRLRGCDGPLRAMRQHADQPPVYGYQFMWGYVEQGEGPIAEPMALRLGAYHALDIAFFFGAWDSLPVNRLVFDDGNLAGRTALSDAMIAYCGRFAWTGDPNDAASGLPRWEPWSNQAGGPKLIRFDGDRTKARISMSHDELTRDQVDAALTALPEPMRTEVEAVGGIMISSAY